SSICLCCPVTQTTGSSRRLRAPARNCRTKGQSLIASGRVPKISRTRERVAVSCFGAGDLLVAVGNASLGEVIWRHLQCDAIAGQHSNAVAPKLACQVSQDCSFLIELNAEKPTRELFNHGSGYLDTIFFTHSPLLGRVRAHKGACAAHLRLYRKRLFTGLSLQRNQSQSRTISNTYGKVRPPNGLTCGRASDAAVTEPSAPWVSECSAHCFDETRIPSQECHDHRRWPGDREALGYRILPAGR